MVRTNEEFHVLRIAKTPAGLSYEGTPISMMGTGASVMPLLSDVAEIPGESQSGWYDLETGEIEPFAIGEIIQVQAVGAPELPPNVDPSWLRRVLAVNLDEDLLARLAERKGISPIAEKPAMIESLLEAWPAADLLEAALDLYITAEADTGPKPA
jgi:hypothetical protein